MFVMFHNKKEKKSRNKTYINMLRKVFLNYQLDVWERKSHGPIFSECLQVHNMVLVL